MPDTHPDRDTIVDSRCHCGATVQPNRWWRSKIEYVCSRCHRLWTEARG